MTRATLRGILWAVAGAALAAGYLVPYKAASGRAGANAVALPMLLIAALANTLVTALHRREGNPVTRTWLWAALILGVSSAVGNEAMAWSLRRIEPGLASVVLRTQVLWVGLGGWWLLRERVGLRLWAGAAVALGGLAMMRLGGDQVSSASAAGILWALAAALSFAAMQLTVRRTIHRIDILEVNALRLWVAVALLALLPGRLVRLADLDGAEWALIAVAAVVGPVASRLCLMESLRSTPVALSTLVLFTGPAFAYGLGGVVFRVWPSPLEIAASVVILAGIALPVVGMLRRPSAPG